MGRALEVLRNAGFLFLLVGYPAAVNSYWNDDNNPISLVNDGGQEEVNTDAAGRNLNRSGQKFLRDSYSRIYRGTENVAKGRQYCNNVDSSSDPGGPGLKVSGDAILTGYIYGGSQQKEQYWPLNNITYDEYPYVVSHKDNQGIAERYWLTSNGEYSYVDARSPLFIDQNVRNESSLKFVFETKAPYPTTRPSAQNYTKCSFKNARYAHEYAVQEHFKRPKILPDENMIHNSIWLTSVRYGKNINQRVVQNFAEEIVKNGFTGSQIQIDDSWESCYGSFSFDKDRFPDMKSLSATLKKMGFRVTLWVHPFISTNCDPYYTEALEKEYFVKNEAGEVNTAWWNGEAGVIDFTNKEAVKWWSRRIRKMKEEYDIDSLKFDAGETSWLPQTPVLSGDISLQPNIYSQKFAQTAATFGNAVVVRVGFQTQDLPVFVRMQDKDSRWGFDNGLRTLLTTLFQMNMAGYPFVLPDKVGGSGGEGRPSKELFIRWLQATVFMPAMQFSYAPWDYDNETIAIAKKYVDLHEKISHVILGAMTNVTFSGAPVNFPIWWISPDDRVAQVINDEYLLGEDILVAPILEEGATSRDIYLPKGLWIDMMRKEFEEVITGPVWLRNYTAKLEDLPYFVMNTSLKRVCEIREDGKNWCTSGDISYVGRSFLVFILSASVILKNYL